MPVSTVVMSTPTVASDKAGHNATRKLDTRVAAVEQDHRERQVADQVGRCIVVEDDSAAIDTRHHAHGEDDDQNRDAEARRKRTDQDARGYQQRSDQEQAVDSGSVQGRYSIENETKAGRAETDHAVRVPRDLTC